MRNITVKQVVVMGKLKSVQVVKYRIKVLKITGEIKKKPPRNHKQIFLSEDEVNRILSFGCIDSSDILDKYISREKLLQSVGCSASLLSIKWKNLPEHYFMIDGKKTRFYTIDEYNDIKGNFNGKPKESIIKPRKDSYWGSYNRLS